MVDDHSIVRDGIKAILETETGITVVGDTGSGEEALELIETYHPDVVMLDISMPGLSGVETARKITALNTACHILVLTMHEEKSYIFEMLDAGAIGFLLKTASRDKIIAAVKSVAEGKHYFGAHASAILAQNLISGGSNTSQVTSTKAPVTVLTAREREILALVGKGLTSVQIAEQLFISSRTVDTHRCNLMKKLKLKTLGALIRFAIENGFTDK